jgi:hypothetical protein
MSRRERVRVSKMFFGLVGCLATTVLAYGAPPADAYQVSYAANLSAGFSSVNITNAGATGGVDPAANICANIYVFAQDQQLIECCGCRVTPNDLQTIGAIDLVSNTLTPGAPTGITVALLATADPTNSFCDAGSIDPATLVPGMRAWNTVVHKAPGGGYAVTENQFLPAQLSASELTKMTQLCGFIEANGSFFGTCKGCLPGAFGAAKQ